MSYGFSSQPKKKNVLRNIKASADTHQSLGEGAMLLLLVAGWLLGVMLKIHSRFVGRKLFTCVYGWKSLGCI